MATLRTILILCTGNSARSILGEALINHLPALRGRFVGYSAGSQPKDRPNSHALACLRRHGLPTERLSSKSWNVFAAAGAPKLDLIITVCDSAASETCPLWPGHPVSAHWGLPDPAAVSGSEAEIAAAFDATFEALTARLEKLAAIDFEALDESALRTALAAIAET